MDITAARARFDRLRASGIRCHPVDLDDIWSALDTVDYHEIMGRWRGSDFDTGHPLGRQLVTSRWYGKRFALPNRAQPLLCRAEDGSIYSDVKLGGGGEASLWHIEFRGEVTATMVYDRAPIFDHFKRVDDRTLMGIMNGAPDVALHQGEHYYLILDRDVE